MDELDRLYRRLLHNIRSRRPEFLAVPFTVRELYEQLVPYRHNRRELAIETNHDYETAVARLMAGERGYVRGDPGMQAAVARELASPTGDPGIFKEFAEAQLTLAPVAEGAQTPVPARTAAGAGAGPIPPGGAGAAAAMDAPTAERSAGSEVTEAYDAMSPGPSVPSATPAAAVPSLLSSLSSSDLPTGCRFCSGTLPEGREVNYCPHCGENLRTRRCPACGAEMDAGWKFCAGCGRRGD